MTDQIPKEVSISDRKKIEFWCKHFGCSAKDLEEAINRIGSSPDEVKLYLQNKPGKHGLAFWGNYME